MGRENKFRVWDNLSKTMEHNPSITIDVNIIKAIKGKVKIWLNQWLNEPTPDCEKQDEYLGKIVEQYTGLKDKNGKEIYEGDVVKIIKAKRFNDKGELVNTRKKTMGVYIVLFDELNGEYVFCERNDLDTAEFGGFSYWAEYEVIGNIHENGELLDKNNRV